MILTYKDWMKIVAQSGIEFKISKDGTKIKAIQNGQIVAEEKIDKKAIKKFARTCNKRAWADWERRMKKLQDNKRKFFR